ncbi:hypothetical protein TFLX_01086 [Thermoflexales bacterium]|nr:hypothetical protein TFLX_01086 [Thermoflexales bacterium]
MANVTKESFLKNLSQRYGTIRKLDGSLSLYEVGDGAARVYSRYSKIHSKNQAFYGLREEDLRKLEGHAAVICFLWEDQKEPLSIPFSEYEDVFHSTTPAGDGQYKSQIYLKGSGAELYIAGAGRFNVEAYFGWNEIDSLVYPSQYGPIPDFTHSQIQTLLGSIGTIKGYDVWIPHNDRSKLGWASANEFACCDTLPHGYESVGHILQEIDVIWIERGSTHLRALFEVEHSTPIYSGLLRFNDIHLVVPNLHPRYSIVANDARRAAFVRQINRPTFRASGLDDLCTFFEYVDVAKWHIRMKKDEQK